ncbi:MAG: HAMP domain-containing histidine kinase [Clostridiaceae bacterium]|nr:HAMP domain-containing histidine kinase [Clostridiaceae bacterium]
MIRLFTSIKQKLTFIYILLIAIPLFMINFFAVESMQESILREIEVNALKTANIVSSISRNNIQQPLALKRSINQYMTGGGARTLVLDNVGRVMVDTSNLLENTVINNQEVRQALQMKEKLGYYQTDKYILQVAVPIIETTGDSRSAIGAVLVSVSVEEAFRTIHDFRQRLMILSVTAAFLAMMVAVFAGRSISKPIVSLSKVAKKIGEGQLGKTVSIESRDEIGQLAENFNYMSKELHRIDKGRTQFIGDVSHELKTPLASMKALIDSLLYGEDDIEVYREYLGDMDSEIDRLSALVGSLLTLTKIEETGIRKDIFSLKEMVEESVKILNPLAQKYGVEVVTMIEDTPNIICDGDRIKEVFINLIDNAMKYRDVEKAQNRVYIKGRRKKYSYEITIEDNGIGIKEEELQSIFEKFYRTDLSRSRDTGGAGIGLSIVSRVVKLHHWELEVKSKIKEGTSITIVIPNTSLKNSL